MLLSWLFVVHLKSLYMLTWCHSYTSKRLHVKFCTPQLLGGGVILHSCVCKINKKDLKYWNNHRFSSTKCKVTRGLKRITGPGRLNRGWMKSLAATLGCAEAPEHNSWKTRKTHKTVRSQKACQEVKTALYVCMCVCVCVCSGDSGAPMALGLSRQSIYSVLRGADKQMLSNFSQE